MTINARSKGARGEREFCVWLEKNLGVKVSRNIDQVREGGIDILGVGNFAFEIKRVEKPDLEGFWLQAKREATKINKIPIVAYRRNNYRWQFLIGPENLNCKYGFIQLKEKTFIEWIKQKL